MTDARQRRGRREQPIDPSAPEHQRRFAQALRALRDRCGQPPYRELQGLANCSHSVLSTAASGRELPSWEITSAYVRGCLRYASRPDEAIAAELADWEKRWQRASAREGRSTVSLVSTLPSAAELYRELRREMTDGRYADAVDASADIAVVSGDPAVESTAVLFQFGGLISLDDLAGCPSLIERMALLLRQCPDQGRLGELHAFTGYVAYRHGALERAITHLMCSERALARAAPSLEVADAWHDLAHTYSLIGLAGRALADLRRARRVGSAAGVSVSEMFAPYIPVRYALSLDHRGDSQGCIRVLRNVIEEAMEHLRDGLLATWPVAQPYVEYAVARLDALGEPVSVSPALVERVGEPQGPAFGGMQTLTAISKAIASDDPDRALDAIASASIVGDPLGEAELLRLRSLAHAAAGQHREALEVERHAVRQAARETDKLHDILLDKIDQHAADDLWSYPPTGYDVATLIDSLTGLPNRRLLEQAVLELGTQRRLAVVGSLAVDSYRDVAEAYGQRCADLLLQQIARSISRRLRDDDLLARVDTDEFALLLPDLDPASAEVVGGQLAKAASAEGRAVLSSTADVAVRVGWAAIEGRAGLDAAYRRARALATCAR